MGSDQSRIYTALIIVDPKSFGGDVTILVAGKTFNVRGALKRGLRSLEQNVTPTGGER